MLSLLNDFETMEIFRNAKTEYIQNFKESKTQNLLIELKPNSIKDLCNIYSINRENVETNLSEYLTNNKNESGIKYIHPILKKYLEDTFGVILYNEQITNILQDISGFSNLESDLVRKTLGRRSVNDLQIYFKKFYDGAFLNKKFLSDCETIKKEPENCIEEIWDLLNEKIVLTISFSFVLKEVSKSYIEALEFSRNKKTIS